MKTIAEIRLDNLEVLIAEFGTQDRVAELAETSPVYISQLRNKAKDSKTGKHRQIGDPMARKLEAGCGKELGWMDNPQPAAGQPAASEPAGVYALAGRQVAWPFQNVSATDFERLSDFARGQVEGYIKGLLQTDGGAHRKSNGA